MTIAVFPASTEVVVTGQTALQISKAYLYLVVRVNEKSFVGRGHFGIEASEELVPVVVV